MIFRRSATKAQYQLFHLRFGKKPFQALCSVYLNLRQFGKVVIDRFAVYAGRKFNITIENNDWLEDSYSSELPLVILSGHAGNFELAGYFLHPKQNKQMYVVLYGGEKEIVMQNRSKFLSANNIHLIAAQADNSYLFEINNALADGHLLAILADRMLGSNRILKTEILGKEAQLPLGPFKTALLRPANKCVVYAIKKNTFDYTIYLRPVNATTPQELADEYAKITTEIITQNPYQWYNYYNFWND